jgi:hypothetical protein
MMVPPNWGRSPWPDEENILPSSDNLKSQVRDVLIRVPDQFAYSD